MIFSAEMLYVLRLLLFSAQNIFFAIEVTLQENLVRTGEFRREIVPVEQTVCWQR